MDGISESTGKNETPAEFDEFAEDYDAALGKGLALSGEGKEYFAAGRMRWLAGLLQKMGESPRVAVDFGCGTGTATPFFFDILGVEAMIGADPSETSLDEARRTWAGRPGASFVRSGSEPEGEADLVYCNGVFHHVPTEDRAEAVGQVARALKPGGLFAFWENNPWNPVTRYAMSRVPFDRDAILVWPGGARRLLREGGFGVRRTDYCFFFPRMLRVFRPLESGLCKVPLGGQYLVLGRKSR